MRELSMTRSSFFSLSLFNIWKNIDVRAECDKKFFFSLYFFFSKRTLMREFSIIISSFLCFLLQKNIFTRAPIDKKFLFRDLSFNDSSSCDLQWVRGSNFQGSPFSKFPANYQSFTLQMLIRQTEKNDTWLSVTHIIVLIVKPLNTIQLSTIKSEDRACAKWAWACVCRRRNEQQFQVWFKQRQQSLSLVRHRQVIIKTLKPKSSLSKL